MVPDYTISHEEIFASGEIVAMFGMAQGTFAQHAELKKENFWKDSSSLESRGKG